MRILFLNPNTSQSVTGLLAAAARAAAPPDVEVEAVTASRGVPYIATRAEAAIGGAVVLEMLAERHHAFDAAVIAAFGDPGLGGARELFDIPVIGLAEAGMLTACALGRRFGIVTFSPTLGPWYEECVMWHGMRERSAGIFAADVAFADIGEVQAHGGPALVAVAERAVEHGADVIVLAGAPLAGLAETVKGGIPVPVVDCAAASVGLAASLVRLAPDPPRRGTYRRPDAKPSIGLASDLARRLAHR